MRRLQAAFPEGERRRRLHYLLGLDFDGTLAPIAAKPGLAKLPPENRRLLRRLVALRRARVAIVSGRGLADVKRKVSGVPGLIYVGNHGLEIQDHEGRLWVHPQARRNVALMRRLAARLAVDLKEFPGVFVENKGLTLSVHYRRLPRYLSERPIHEMIQLLIAGQKDRVAIRHGKKVWEIRPVLEWNKGYALRRLLGSKAAAADWVPCLVGDDFTDEEGFRSLGPEAITVRVGYKKDSHARFRVKNQKQVARLLEYFAREWRGPVRTADRRRPAEAAPAPRSGARPRSRRSSPPAPGASRTSGAPARPASSRAPSPERAPSRPRRKG